MHGVPNVRFCLKAHLTLSVTRIKTRHGHIVPTPRERFLIHFIHEPRPTDSNTHCFQAAQIRWADAFDRPSADCLPSHSGHLHPEHSALKSWRGWFRSVHRE